jgi:hypothetical protein
MDNALSEWLRQRESADTAARSTALTQAIVDALPLGEPLRILDLATGQGSNVRFLAERLPGPQRWLAVDRSALLLTVLRDALSAWGADRGYAVRREADLCSLRGTDVVCDVETQEMDLGTLSRRDIFAGRHLVTASALLDLVSESWLLTLAARCREVSAAALFTITYNGHFSCFPEETEDAVVRALMNQHQKTDKGLGGPAAGPGAAVRAEQCFKDAGYSVRREPSDWMLSSADADVQRALVDGWAEAAMEMAPEQALLFGDWRARRLAHVDAGRSRLTVGHDDLAAWLPHG